MVRLTIRCIDKIVSDSLTKFSDQLRGPWPLSEVLRPEDLWEWPLGLLWKVFRKWLHKTKSFALGPVRPKMLKNLVLAKTEYAQRGDRFWPFRVNGMLIFFFLLFQSKKTIVPLNSSPLKKWCGLARAQKSGYKKSGLVPCPKAIFWAGALLLGRGQNFALILVSGHPRRAQKMSGREF